jgi:hypothetical protein
MVARAATSMEDAGGEGDEDATMSAHAGSTRGDGGGEGRWGTSGVLLVRSEDSGEGEV